VFALLRRHDAPFRALITGWSLNFDPMVILGREGRRSAAEKHGDVNTPWAMVVDDDNWPATWTSDHHQQPAKRRTSNFGPVKKPSKPNRKPTCSCAK